ncbi:hypothetical protein [Loigolactobacillus zhaoyuanensis]|uniref:Uncharacterized protein n=1 Tax=Loigolactobacillus zhaoyuanensis TaxID=2486017 RepID=A0ABW8UD51_9LACO
MDPYLDTYANWYPSDYQVGAYPRSNGARQYTETERMEIYRTLTTAQRNVVNDYKRRQISSAMLNISYMRDAEWVFVQRNVDPDFVRGKPAKYHCICHRPLKYQFVLQARSDATIVKKLGIKHFSDHLGIPLKVVNEIQAGVHKIDLAFDELLWLKRQRYSFPTSLWRRYVYAHFINNQLAVPYKMNHHLWLRLLDFKQADMPIFTLDHATVLNEIAQIDQLADAAAQPLAAPHQETFEHYLADVQAYSKLPLFKFANFWNASSQPFLTKWALAHDAQPGDFYFRQLLQVLQTPSRWKYSWATFPFKAGTKLVQPDVSQYMAQLAQRYPLDENFFNELPLFFRRGLRQALREQKAAAKPAPTTVAPPRQAAPAPQQYASHAAALQLYNQWRSIAPAAQADAFAQFQLLVQDDLAPQVAGQLNSVFFDKLFNLLLTLNPLNAAQTKQPLQQLLQRSAVAETNLAAQLLAATTAYQRTADFTTSFSAVPAPFYAELAQRFDYLTILE